MRVYLDTCAIQRPLDDLAQLRVRVEAEAVLAVITAAEMGGVDLVASDVLQFETENNPFSHRRDFGRRVTGLAMSHVATTPSVSARATDYERAGLRPLDAVHLASAVEAEADRFCTADDALLKKGKRANTEATRVVSPLELIADLEP
ncbi:PIN domain-containing protein [Rubrivirga sp.]|uniref:PIN domain-containing protein n=1 Tax=Rubrivirga sp. TaxID=1885344 RepID=UPI003B527E87